MDQDQAQGPFSDDLVYPIYIDTNVLLDLLASLEGGFSVVEKVTTRAATTKDSESSANAGVGTEFGIPNVLNLLKVNVGGSVRRQAGQSSSQELERERYHTYGSLLYRLRLSLVEQDLIRQFDGTPESWDEIQPSDFVEL